MKSGAKAKTSAIPMVIPYTKILQKLGKKKNLSKTSISSSSIVQTQDFSNVSTISSATHPKTSSKEQETSNKYCFFHSNKKAKYSSEDGKYFCSKCAVEQAQFGNKVNVMSIDPIPCESSKRKSKDVNPKKDSRSSELNFFLESLKSTKSNLNKLIGLASSKNKSISSFVSKQESFLEHIFNEIVTFYLQKKKEAVEQLTEASDFYSNCYSKLELELGNYSKELEYMAEDIESNFENILLMQNQPYSEIINRYRNKFTGYEEFVENLKNSKIEVLQAAYFKKESLSTFLKNSLGENKLNPFKLIQEETHVLTKREPNLRNSFLSFVEEPFNIHPFSPTANINLKFKMKESKENIDPKREPLQPLVNLSQERKPAVRLRTTRDGIVKVEGFYSPGIQLRTNHENRRGIFSSPQFKNNQEEKKSYDSQYEVSDLHELNFR